eukprot:6226440-Amphidinium_carterae.2
MKPRLIYIASRLEPPELPICKTPNHAPKETEKHATFQECFELHGFTNTVLLFVNVFCEDSGIDFLSLSSSCGEFGLALNPSWRKDRWRPAALQGWMQMSWTCTKRLKTLTPTAFKPSALKLKNPSAKGGRSQCTKFGIEITWHEFD